MMLAVLVTALCAVAASHNARAATVIHANDTVTQADIVSYPETVEYYANALDVDTLVRKRAAVSSASVMRLRALFEREIFARAACRLSADRRHRREIFKNRAGKDEREVSLIVDALTFFPLSLSLMRCITDDHTFNRHLRLSEPVFVRLVRWDGVLVRRIWHGARSRTVCRSSKLASGYSSRDVRKFGFEQVEDQYENPTVRTSNGNFRCIV